MNKNFIKLMATFLFTTQVFANVNFITPKENEVVPATFPVEFSVEGMKVAKAGELAKGTGHHHIIVDGTFVKEGQVVPKNESHIHFGDASTKTTLTLKPGKHTLTLQFADGMHKSYGEKFSKTIAIEVK